MGPRSNLRIRRAGLSFDAEAPSARTQCSALKASGLVTEQTLKPFIAIVDDDESVCRALKRLVRSLGMEADTFVSSREFIDRLEGTRGLHIDCIVLDLHMPNMNGLEVQQRLAETGNRSPVIFITAHDDTGARAQALAAGAVGFLQKPFSDESLLEALRQALEHRFVEP